MEGADDGPPGGMCLLVSLLDPTVRRPAARRKDGAERVRARLRLCESAVGDLRDAELAADRPAEAGRELPVTGHERLGARLDVLPGVVCATTAAGHRLGVMGAQPALQVSALHGVREARW